MSITAYPINRRIAGGVFAALLAVAQLTAVEASNRKSAKAPSARAVAATSTLPTAKSQVAVKIRPGQGAKSARLVTVDRPLIGDIEGGMGVRLQVLAVGRCGTDHEIEDYGLGGDQELITGHEILARVIEVGPNVRGVKVGDLVSPTNTRPKDANGKFRRRTNLEGLDPQHVVWPGISGADGGLREEMVEHARFLVKVPAALGQMGVLGEPQSVISKTFARGYATQQALLGRKHWRPKRALVVGDGAIGILAALQLRMDGVQDVVVVGRTESSVRAILKGIGVDLQVVSREPAEAAQQLVALAGKKRFELAFNAAPSARTLFDAIGTGVMSQNSVMLLSGTEGGGDTTRPTDQAAFNNTVVREQVAVVGSVSAGKSDFRRGIQHLTKVEKRYPGWLQSLVTPLGDLPTFARKMQTGEMPRAIKGVVNVAP